MFKTKCCIKLVFHKNCRDCRCKLSIYRKTNPRQSLYDNIIIKITVYDILPDLDLIHDDLRVQFSVRSIIVSVHDELLILTHSIVDAIINSANIGKRVHGVYYRDS